MEIEIASTGQPDDEQLPWLFFREVQKLPELTNNVAARTDGAGQIALSSLKGRSESISQSTIASPSTSISHDSSSSSATPLASKLRLRVNTNVHTSERAEDANEKISGFPLHFPSIEVEVLEDISLRVSLVSVVNGSKIVTSGALLLTNFRLIFVCLSRILKSSNINNYHPKSTIADTPQITLSSELDVTLHIPICSIVHVSLTSEVETEQGGNGSYNEAIRIKTSDFRNMTFAFRDDDAFRDEENSIAAESTATSRRGSIDEAMKSSRLKRPSNSDSDSLHVEGIHLSGNKTPVNRTGERRHSSSKNSFRHGGSIDLYESNAFGKGFSQLEESWHRLAREHPYIVEALDSEEGPPVHRIYRRLKYNVSS